MFAHNMIQHRMWPLIGLPIIICGFVMLFYWCNLFVLSLGKYRIVVSSWKLSLAHHISGHLGAGLPAAAENGYYSEHDSGLFVSFIFIML